MTVEKEAACSLSVFWKNKKNRKKNCECKFHIFLEEIQGQKNFAYVLGWKTNFFFFKFFFSFFFFFFFVFFFFFFSMGSKMRLHAASKVACSLTARIAIKYPIGGFGRKGIGVIPVFLKPCFIIFRRLSNVLQSFFFQLKIIFKWLFHYFEQKNFFFDFFVMGKFARIFLNFSSILWWFYNVSIWSKFGKI